MGGSAALFIALEAEQSAQHEPIITATFHGNLCHLNLLSPTVRVQIHPLDQNPFQGRGDNGVRVRGSLRSTRVDHQPIAGAATVIYIHKNSRFKISNQRDSGVGGNESTLQQHGEELTLSTEARNVLLRDESEADSVIGSEFND